MSVTTVGVRELQQHSSRLVRDVEQNDTEYRISVQGRDTGVVLTKNSGRPVSGVLLSEVVARGLWRRNVPDEVRRQMLAEIEAGRDAVGFVGQ